MALRSIDQKRILIAWHCFVQNLNKQQPLIRRTRIIVNKKTKAKEEQVYYTQKPLISGCVKDTGTRLIIMYCEAYYQAMKTPVLAQAYNDTQLPGLPMNCPKLAEQRTKSDRTMRTHIRKLQEQGVELISGYKFRGRHADFQLWINPKFLWPTDPAAQNENSKNSQNALVSAPQSTNLPPFLLQVTQDTKERDSTNVQISGVAKPQHVMPEGDDTGHTFTGYIGPHKGLISSNEPPAEPLEASSQDTLRKLAAAAPKDEQAALFLRYIENFWQYAQAVIYPHHTFSPADHEAAKAAIYEGVYYGFRANWSRKRWDQYQKRLFKRIDLVDSYFNNTKNEKQHRKRQEQYVPFPYAVYKKGMGYFDKENAFGFAKTHEWLLRKEAWKLQKREDYAIEKAVKTLKAHKLKQAPEKIQAMPLQEVFKLYYDKISPLGPKALERYCVRIQKIDQLIKIENGNTIRHYRK